MKRKKRTDINMLKTLGVQGNKNAITDCHPGAGQRWQWQLRQALEGTSSASDRQIAITAVGHLILIRSLTEEKVKVRKNIICRCRE